MQKKNEELVNLASRLNHCMQFADSAIKNGSDVALVSSKRAINNQVQTKFCSLVLIFKGSESFKRNYLA